MRRRIPPSRGARTVIATTGIARAAARIAARARVRVRSARFWWRCRILRILSATTRIALATAARAWCWTWVWRRGAASRAGTTTAAVRTTTRILLALAVASTTASAMGLLPRHRRNFINLRAYRGWNSTSCLGIIF